MRARLLVHDQPWLNQMSGIRLLCERESNKRCAFRRESRWENGIEWEHLVRGKGNEKVKCKHLMRGKWREKIRIKVRLELTRGVKL